MKIRRIRIWLSKGWYRVLCSVSLLLIPLFCNTGKAMAATPQVPQVTKDPVPAKKGDSTPDTINKETVKRSTEFEAIRVVAYGPPAASFRRYDDKVTRIVGPDFQSIGIETPDVSVMYGVPTTRYVVSDDMQKPSSAPSYPLIALDGKIVNAPDDKLAAFDFNAVLMDRYQLAELVGTRGDKIKEARTINNKEAEEIWGVRGKNGVLEVFTRKYYRKFIKRVKTLHGTKQPITGLKNKE